MPFSGAPWNTASTHDVRERAMNKSNSKLKCLCVRVFIVIRNLREDFFVKLDTLRVPCK